jgi:hypothetical protein
MLAADLSRQLPTPNPLQLSTEQKLIVGEHLARLLKTRVAFHHSGLSYGARAGVIEPLAKAGQLRVVVATMGLAAGINFSLRSVALAAESYRRDQVEKLLNPAEILQMFGRAGRRGLDETGFVLITPNELRLLDARPCHLSRSGAVDWAALLNIMAVAAQHGRDPFREAVQVQERLFTMKPIFLGVEESLRHPDVPCGLKTDAERARHVRKRVREMVNSRGEWELMKEPVATPLSNIVTPADALRDASSVNSTESADTQHAIRNTAPDFVSVLGVPGALEKVGNGVLCVLSENDGIKTYGRASTVADRIANERVVLAKWVRRLTNWNGRQAPLAIWNAQIVPLLEQKLAQQKTPVVRFVDEAHRIMAQVSIADLTMRVPVDSHGVAIWKPVEREVLPSDCARCSLVPVCRQLPTSTGVALLWRRLGLVDAGGVPTVRGRVVSFFSQGDGLAIAAALEDESYPFDELIYDLANLDAGFRFCGDDNRWGGRLAMVCHEKFGLQTIAGYLENGVPPKYGSGAEQVVASVHKNPLNKNAWVSDLVGAGDIDRVIIEWRSLLRQIAHAPELEWARWQALQAMAKGILNETESPTMTNLPPLEYHQTKRVEHRLVLRRH